MTTNDVDAIFLDRFSALMQEYKSALAASIMAKVTAQLSPGTYTVPGTIEVEARQAVLGLLGRRDGGYAALRERRAKLKMKKAREARATASPLDRMKDAIAGKQATGHRLAKGEAVVKSPPNGRNAIESTILTVLGKHPGSRTGAVVRAVGIPDRTVRDHLKRMAAAKLIMKEDVKLGNQMVPVYSIAS
jgi:hypothetical protein